MEPKAQVSLKIDGREVVVPEGTSILEAARENGFHIPTLCHHPDLSPYGGCRLCVVEVDGAPRLVASCVTPVRNGMDVVVKNERIVEARRTILEFLFAERNHYCMICAQSGDCELQALAYEYQVDHLTVPVLGDEFPVDTTHEDLVIDHNRCVLCGRCIRACQELAGNAVLGFQNRGGRTMVCVDLNGQLGESSCVSCGLCVQLCPTGAIFNRHRTHYAVKGKAKDWQTVESVCPECGLLCPATYVLKGNNLIKVEGLLDGQGPDRGQLCRKGRFDVMKSPASRLREPMVRDENGTWREAGWDEAFDRVRGALKAAGGPALWGLVSSRCSNEEIIAFKQLAAQDWGAGRLDTLDGRHFRITAAARENGASFDEASWRTIPSSDFVLLVGAGLKENHPIIISLIRRAVMENKAKAAVVGRVNPLGDWARLFLPAEADELEPMLRGLLAHSGSVSDREYAELVRLFRSSRDPVLIVGEGLTGAADPIGLKRALDVASLKGRLVILKPNGNSAGAWKLGAASVEAMNGKGPYTAGLMCLGGGETLEPNVEGRLGGLKFLAVMTPYMTEDLVALAHVLIPRPTWLEMEGTYTSADGSREVFKQKVLEPPRGIRTAEQTMAALGR